MRNPDQTFFTQKLSKGEKTHLTEKGNFISKGEEI